ncbi:response regulator [Trinickia caryophylli]|uniref:histidine kinase n=1 Tax=Trinickia caryophylli TaxID=28094 RepID=A0A1X7DXL7_TRICW|nr:response regulator [Trinickia caryophylli]PMS14306.1 hybrid sensor histidine kinase/response regulator [Trinickia caryophylli]TRX17863.1 response regulator [Trinickia caryophylli]WQE11368.1 response regulator [Trinickia caryophylli]SMF23683.1 Signal transduction histidine kinase [Trinickia caryophylli]
MNARVLFVDDDEGLLRLASRSLGRAGYRVDQAATTAAARALMAREMPDVVIVDYALGGLETGLEFLRAVRAGGLVLPAILCTGFADEARVIEALRSGVADVVPKSEGYLDYLPEAIERVLRERRIERELAEAQRAQEREAHFRALAEEREALLASERAARAEAERVSRMKDDFVATLSHELRTPLNAIVGWTQFLLRDASGSESIRKGLDVIDRNARAQARMVDELLDFSRILAGKLRLEIERVDLVDIVEYVIRSVGPAAQAKEIRVNSSLAPVTSILADPARLQQIVWNLLSNAVKFTGKGGAVEVAIVGRDGEVELTVADNGQGIKPEFLPHVFERFCQEDAGIARQYGGLGLGLSIARQLVELHGGRIEAKSDGPGRGASFIVTLPATGAELTSAAPEEPMPQVTPPALAGLRVVIVEDEPDARELVRSVLEERGAQTYAFGHALEALEACMSVPPDVIVSDIGMPGVDGYEFIRRLRTFEAQQGRATPAAALSAFARSEDRRRALLAGFQTHVAKPVDPLELVVVVAALAGRATSFADEQSG